MLDVRSTCIDLIYNGVHPIEDGEITSLFRQSSSAGRTARSSPPS
jgi:hypothetical protein